MMLLPPPPQYRGGLFGGRVLRGSDGLFEFR